MILGAMLLLGSVAHAQLRITEPKENSVSSFRSQFVSGTAPVGYPVRVDVNGKTVDSTTVRPDGVFEFIGVKVPTGPVTFTVVARRPSHREISATRSMHILGSPDSIAIDSTAETMQANGAPISVSVHAFDKWGVQIPGNYFITMNADSGFTSANDADPATPGIQARIENGAAHFTMNSPKQAGTADMTFSVDGVSTQRTIEFVTPVEPLMLVGSADGSVTSLSTSGDLNGLVNESDLEKGVHSNGRLAFYGRGSIWGNYLLTASFDNERRQKDRLFRDLDPDVLYSLYGDNSSVDYTAQTSSPFFAKIEKNRSFVMFGDFNTQMTQNELARYDRTFTGISGRFTSKKTNVDAFATVTNRKVVQDEIRGQGISGYYFLGASNVVAGSEKVRIETRDKRHNEVILNRANKARFGDYEIDYTQGTLYFKQPVPSIDDQGNPVYIIVSYEAQSGSASNYVTGAQGEQEIMPGLKVGATVVTEERVPTNYTLLGFNTKYSYNTIFNAKAEIAHGSDVSNSGSAWRVDVGGSPTKDMQLKSYFSKIDNGFVNQTAGAGGASEIGSTKYGIGGSYSGVSDTKLLGDYYRTEQASGNTNVFVNSISGGVERSLGKYASLALKAENLKYESDRTDTSITETNQSTLLSAKTTVTATDQLKMTAEYEQSIGASTQSQVKPSNASIGAEYKIMKNITVSAQQKFYIGSGNATSFGIGSNVGYGTTVTGRYEIGNGISGARNQASIGLKNVLKLTDDLTSNLSYERTRALDRNIAEVKTNDNDAVSLGFEYLPKKSYKASIKGEFAKNQQSTRRGLTFGGDIRVASDFTLIDKMTYYEEQASQSQSSFADGTLSSSQAGTSLGSGLLKKFNNAIGLAYRPVDFDWLNAIGKFEKKIDFNGLVSPKTSSDVNIVSLHTFIEPIIGLEIGTKYALKYASEESYGLQASTLTDFYLVRADYDLHWNNFDVAAEYRILNSRIVGQDNSNSVKNGYSAEIGYIAFQNIRIAGGYNFVGTQEQDLVGKDYWSAGPFLSVQMKFTEKIANMFNK